MNGYSRSQHRYVFLLTSTEHLAPSKATGKGKEKVRIIVRSTESKKFQASHFTQADNRVELMQLAHNSLPDPGGY